MEPDIFSQRIKGMKERNSANTVFNNTNRPHLESYFIIFSVENLFLDGVCTPKILNPRIKKPIACLG